MKAWLTYNEVSRQLSCCSRRVACRNPQRRLQVIRRMAIEFHFTPELHLKDGRVIRDLDDALSFAREQEARPGVDQRDEILHKIEHARRKEEAHAAAHSFLRWLEEL